MATRKNYNDVREQTRQQNARIQLDEPDGHFPYKAEQVRQALATPPDPDTNNHPEQWYTSPPIIDATGRMVEAQERYLQDPGDGTREAYEQAKRDLVDARQAHRRGRPIAPVAMAGSPADIEQRRSMIRGLLRSGNNPDEVARQFGLSLAEVQSAQAGMEDS